MARNRALQLDGQVGNAAAGVNHPGADNRLGGAGIEAEVASAAQILGRRVSGPDGVGDQAAQKEKRTMLQLQQVAVLANPSQASRGSQGFLHQRAAVNEDQVSASAARQHLRQCFKFGAQHVVIITSPGIAADGARGWVLRAGRVVGVTVGHQGHAAGP